MKWSKRASVGLIGVVELPCHKVRVYENRLAIWRKDGGYLTWDEIQKIKELFWEGQLAIELYPKQSQVVNIKNTRHLWRVDSDTTKIILEQCSHLEFSRGK
jgi:hypothetical protein